MKKKFFALILSFLFVIILAGCTNVENGQNGSVQAEFADKEWKFYDEVTAENLCLNLGSDGSFSYHCECGEPVGDSDIYEIYSYDEESGMITLSNSYDDSTKEIEVIGFNEYHLMVKIDGELKDFVLEGMDTKSNFYAFEGESYLEGYHSHAAIVDIQDGKIIYGPIGYDPEGIYEDGPFEEYEMAENVPVFELLIRSYFSIQGDEEYEEYYDVAFTELEQEEIEFILDNGAGEAFLWFDDELRVEKIVFYGHLSVTADYVALTVPAELADETTQEELDSEVKEGVYDVAKLYEDGSIFYLMDQYQYEAARDDLKKIYQESIK